MIYSVTIVLLCTILQLSAAVDQYCATVDPATADGASGYFAMQIGDGSATYGLSLDLTNFPTTCNLTQGLSYHIHSYWKNTTASSTTNSLCGASIAGGHYDPNFACSIYSQNYTNACAAINRDTTSGYVYSCSAANYAAGKYSTCEVGDLSGKNGKLYANPGTLVFDMSEFVDYLPPYAYNYNALDTNSLQWTSIVFHCAENANRLVCAKLDPTDLSACSSTFASFNTDSTDDNNDDNGYSKHELDTAIIVSVVVCSLVGLAVGFFLGRGCCPSSPAMASDTK